MDSKRQPATTLSNRTGSSEKGRNVAGGRRATKKDMGNNEISDSNGTVDDKTKEEVNVLRTRSGRTRTATNLNNAASSRKKATITSTAKPSSIEMDEIKAKKAISSEVMKAKVS